MHFIQSQEKRQEYEFNGNSLIPTREGQCEQMHSLRPVLRCRFTPAGDAGVGRTRLRLGKLGEK